MCSVTILCSCQTTPTPESQININILSDEQELLLHLSPGSTVQEALDTAGISLGPLDRVDPVAYTVLTDGTKISVVRVREEFEVEKPRGKVYDFKDYESRMNQFQSVPF